LHGRVDAIVVRMEQDANRLIEALHGNAGAMTEIEAPK